MRPSRPAGAGCLFIDRDRHAQRHLEELRAELARDDHRGVGFVVAAMEVMLAIRTGDLEQAERLAEACARRGDAAGDADATGWHAAQLVAIRWYQGRLAEVLPMLGRLVRSPTLSAVDNSMGAALAVAAATAGDHQTAASALAAVCGSRPSRPAPVEQLAGHDERCRGAAHVLGDAETAGRAYDLLRPHADLPMVASLGVACFGSVHHALGVASLTTGDLDRAVTHLRTAITRNLALAHWPAVVTSRQRLAQGLALRALPPDTVDAQLS